MKRDRDCTRLRYVPFCAISLSLLTLAVVSVCYAFQPDGAAAVTLWPPWAWAVPGLLVTAVGWRAGRRLLAATAGLWLLFVAAISDELPALLRFGGPAPGTRPALRVVSLNCAGGNVRAAEEVLPLHPDLVLLQEVPQRREVETLAWRLFGGRAGVLYGWDTAVLAPERILAVQPARRASFFVHGRTRLRSGPTVDVVSLRLLPPVIRMDLWNPGCWSEHTESRRARREQLREGVDSLDGTAPDTPLVVGGDFNAPAGDGIFALLRPRLRDGFAEAGTGWGDTGLNDIPLARPDQVWVSAHFRAVRVIARRTQYSDHRMVVSDLQLG